MAECQYEFFWHDVIYRLVAAHTLVLFVGISFMGQVYMQNHLV